jgi:hypothetical protein
VWKVGILKRKFENVDTSRGTSDLSLLREPSPSQVRMSCHGCSSGASRTPYSLLNYSPGAKWVKSLTKSRLSNFSGGHFADVNLSSILFTHRIDSLEHVKLQVWSAPGLTKPTFEEAMKQKFKPAKKGDSFGPSCMLSKPLPFV